jgi:hypothetical protein
MTIWFREAYNLHMAREPRTMSCFSRKMYLFMTHELPSENLEDGTSIDGTPSISSDWPEDPRHSRTGHIVKKKRKNKTLKNPTKKSQEVI